jgi:hypothetical protein
MQKFKTIELEDIQLKKLLSCFNEQAILKNLQLGDTAHSSSGYIDENILEGKNTVADLIAIDYNFEALVLFECEIDDYKIELKKEIFYITAPEWKLKLMEANLRFRITNMIENPNNITAFNCLWRENLEVDFILK